SMGPTNKSLFISSDLDFDALAENFYLQAKALIQGGVDYLLLETMMDTLNIKAGFVGINQAFKELNTKIPVAISVTIEKNGTLLAGQNIEAVYTSIEHMNPLYVGLNCATGPAQMQEHIRVLNSISRFPIAVAPNAGIPDENGTYPEDPKEFIAAMDFFLRNNWVNVLGGCCGTNPRYINELSQLVKKCDGLGLISQNGGDSKGDVNPATRISGNDALTIDSDSRPYLVGERANVIGSRAFKRLIEADDFDAAAEIVRKQVGSGAHVIDICLTNPDRDEVEDTNTFLKIVTKLVKVPLMIDSQDEKVLLTAFKLNQGKIILNSVNLENGEELFAKLLPLVKLFGAAVVVGTIYHHVAVKAEDKILAAQKSYELITEKYEIAPENIIFDPLVFPIATEDEKYQGAASETIKAIKMLKAKFPDCKTILGLSNVSFGLPIAGREVLNTVFLHLCVEAGLDFAIVNTEKFLSYAQLTDQEKDLAVKLIENNTRENITEFANYFKDQKPSEKLIPIESLTDDQRLTRNVILGSKEKLIETVEACLKEHTPLVLINDVLMKAMAEVGAKFAKNELIITEVLRSSEVMRIAIDHLQPLLPKEHNKKGKLLLATVKGDVHDIGKNLVQVIFSSNGYEVIDLGINCTNEQIVAAFKEYQPDLIGLSGLLVKSTEQMVLAVQDFNQVGISVPVLLGGAALSQKFVDNKIEPVYKGQVFYASDAMQGLMAANKLKK
ncbi:MAG: homocysteine S-methyltransferase family protein, partial [Candidatus Margulisiibacteriota bacterium]